MWSTWILPLCTVLYILTLYWDLEGFFLFVQYYTYLRCIVVYRNTSSLYSLVHTYAVFRYTGILSLCTVLYIRQIYFDFVLYCIYLRCIEVYRDNSSLYRIVILRHICVYRDTSSLYNIAHTYAVLRSTRKSTDVLPLCTVLNKHTLYSGIQGFCLSV